MSCKKAIIGAGAAGLAARHRVIPVLLFALATASAIALHQRVETPGADESAYAVLGSNLLAGRGYEFNFQPYTVYPPGLPFIYRMVGVAFGVGYTTRVMTSGVFAFLGLVAAYFVLRRRASDGTALGITLLLASSSYFFAQVTDPASDIPYFALAFVCLYTVDRLWFDALSAPTRILLLAGLCVCLPLTVLTRMVGVALLPAILVFLVIQGLKGKECGAAKWLALGLPVVMGVAALVLWTHWASTHKAAQYQGEFADSYITHLFMKDFHNAEAGKATAADFAARIITNCGCGGASFTQMALSAGWIAPGLWSPAVAIPILLVLVGLVQSIRLTGGYASDWYTIFSLLIVLSWWFCDDGRRFLLPIFPLLVFQAFCGWSRLVEMFRNKPKQFSKLIILSTTMVALASIAALLIQHSKPGKQHLASVLFWLVAALGGIAMAFFLARRKTPLDLHWHRRPWRVAWVSLVVVFIAFHFFQDVFSAEKAMYADPRTMLHYPSLLVGKWIVDNTAADAVIMAEQVAILHRLTGRRLVRIPATTDPQLVSSIIEKRRIDYLIVEDREGFRQPDARALIKTLQTANLQPMDLVAQGPGYSIYHLIAK